LKVNTDKTKVMGLKKRGGLLQNESWTYNAVVLDIVDEFNGGLRIYRVVL